MTVRVAVNGYGVIGRRVADAVTLQEDMTLIGVADLALDWRARIAARDHRRDPRPQRDGAGSLCVHPANRPDARDPAEIHLR